MAEVDDSLCVAKPIPGGFTWTLAMRLGDLLYKAESQFGTRDMAYTILGVEFQGDTAQIPRCIIQGERKHIIVQLTASAMKDPHQAMFQLAHECIHLLDPILLTTTVLEEGVAVHFSLEATTVDINALLVHNPNYGAACLQVRRLLALRPNAVKEFRRLYGPMHSATAEQLYSICPQIGTTGAEELARPFKP